MLKASRYYFAGNAVTIWCRPGCRVSISEAEPLVPPTWTDAGTMDPPPGDYDVWCRTGAGEKCEVRLRKV